MIFPSGFQGPISQYKHPPGQCGHVQVPPKKVGKFSGSINSKTFSL